MISFGAEPPLWTEKPQELIVSERNRNQVSCWMIIRKII